MIDHVLNREEHHIITREDLQLNGKYIKKLQGEVETLKDKFNSKNPSGVPLHDLFNYNDIKQAKNRAIFNKLSLKLIKLIEAKSKYSCRVCMSKILENNKYTGTGTGTKQNNTNILVRFGELQNSILEQLSSLAKCEQEEILKAVDDKKTLQQIFKNDFFEKISNGAKEKISAHTINGLEIMKRCILAASNGIKVKLYQFIIKYTTACADRALSATQLLPFLFEAYTAKDESIEKNAMSALVHASKHQAIANSLSKHSVEDLEGIAYLTKYFSDIIFHGEPQSDYIFWRIGISYTQNNGDPVENIETIFSHISDVNEMTSLFPDGIYNDIEIGEPLFINLVLKDDLEYQAKLVEVQGQTNDNDAHKYLLKNDQAYKALFEETDNYDGDKEHTEEEKDKLKANSEKVKKILASYKAKINEGLKQFAIEKAREYLAKLGYLYPKYTIEYPVVPYNSKQADYFFPPSTN